MRNAELEGQYSSSVRKGGRLRMNWAASPVPTTVNLCTRLCSELCALNNT
jgi:hypothetical protein